MTKSVTNVFNLAYNEYFKSKEREAKKMQKEREVDYMKNVSCPFCKSYNYKRDLNDMGDDSAFFNCECQDCGKDFQETFVAKFQNWEE